MLSSQHKVIAKVIVACPIFLYFTELRSCTGLPATFMLHWEYYFPTEQLACISSTAKCENRRSWHRETHQNFLNTSKRRKLLKLQPNCSGDLLLSVLDVGLPLPRSFCSFSNWTPCFLQINTIIAWVQIILTVVKIDKLLRLIMYFLRWFVLFLPGQTESSPWIFQGGLILCIFMTKVSDFWVKLHTDSVYRRGLFISMRDYFNVFCVLVKTWKLMLALCVGI